jgi:hypothetical protein
VTIIIATQVEQSAKERIGSADFWGFHGSSIPVTGFIWFRPEPTGTCQNRQLDTVTGSLRWISGIFRRVPAGNGEFPEGFRRKLTEYCFPNHHPGNLCNILPRNYQEKEHLNNIRKRKT